MTGQSTPQWIYHFGPGDRPELARNPAAWTEADNRIAAAHFEYLQRAGESGQVILAGRAQDGIGPAVVIFEAPTAEAAASFMRSDPFVSEGLFSADLHPFRAAILRGDI
jgi:uncharacterized protein YciI